MVGNCFCNICSDSMVGIQKMVIHTGCHHNTLAFRIGECMGSQWAASDASEAIARNREGPWRFDLKPFVFYRMPFGFFDASPDFFFVLNFQQSNHLQSEKNLLHE